MFNRTTIAHELGHVVAAYVGDPEWRPTVIEFQKAAQGVTSLATTDFDQHEARNCRIADGRFGRIRSFSNLGGLFGELLVRDRFYPWGSRGDVDEFLAANQGSRSKVVRELYRWFYRNEGPHGFLAVARTGDIRKRRARCLESIDVRVCLPELYRLYGLFLGRINGREFQRLVGDVFSGGERAWTMEELRPGLCRVVLKMYDEEWRSWQG